MESDTNVALRLIAIKLDNFLNFERLDQLLLDIIYINFDNLFMFLRYNMAVEFISKETELELLTNPNVISNLLLNYHFDAQVPSVSFAAAEEASKEFSRLIYDEEFGEKFEELILKFDKDIENYVKTSLPGLFGVGLIRVVIEGIFNKTSLISKYLNNVDALKGNFETVLKQFDKTENRLKSIRLGIKRGGKRPRKKVPWTDEYKKRFYETVIELPRKNNSPIWEYILKNLKDNDFDKEYVIYLRNKIKNKEVPQGLFKEAVNSWQAYENADESIKAKDQPKAFEYKHAVHLLGYPEISYETSKKYFREGKKLSQHEK